MSHADNRALLQCADCPASAHRSGGGVALQSPSPLPTPLGRELRTQGAARGDGDRTCAPYPNPRPAPRLSAAAAPDCPGPHPGPSTYTTIQDPRRASKGRADIINRGECFQVVTKGGQDRNLCTHGGGASEGRQLWPCLWGSCTLCGPSAGLVGAQGPTLSRTEPVTLPLSISLRTSLRRFPDQPELCHVLSIQNPHRYRSRFTRCGTKYN